MSYTKTGAATIFILGAAAGAAAALLTAPESGARTRRKLRRQAEHVADYLADSGRELIDRCEDLYQRSGEVAQDASRELSGKYCALRDYTRQVVDDTEAILKRTRLAAVGR